MLRKRGTFTMTEAIVYGSAAAPKGAAAPWSQVQTLLVGGEEVLAFALQHRLYALFHRRHVAAATSGRFIHLRRPLLGGYVPFDVRWQDLKDAQITVGMFSAAVTLTFNANLSDTSAGEGQPRVLRAKGLRIASAQALYRQCQAQEQAWREKRRERSIEELRAASGGVQIATGVYPQAAAAGPPSLPEPPRPRAEDEPAERLARAKSMLDQGLITDAEYEAIKARIVGSL
jgi:hypothetical protein